MAVGASNDERDSLTLVFQQFHRNSVDLKGQLTRRGDDDDSSSISRLVLGLDQEMDGRDQESQSLSGTSFRRSKDVLTHEQGRDTLSLNLSHSLEAHLSDRLANAFIDLETSELVVLRS